MGLPMIIYQDRWFCPFWQKCDKGADCDRALTQAVKDAAHAWFNRGVKPGEETGAPICTVRDRPQCWEPFE